MDRPIWMQAPVPLSRRRLLAAGGAAAAAALGAGRSVAQAQTFPPDLLRRELAALYDGLQAAHFDLFARTPRARYDQAYRMTLAGLDRPLSKLETERAFQRFAAVGRVAHARIDYLLPAFRAFRAGGGRALPLKARIRDGRIFVVADAGGTLRPGSEITRFAGLPAAALLARLWAHVSADTAYMAQSLIELDFAALVWTAFGEARAFDLTVDGRRLTLPTLTKAEAAKATLPDRLSIDPTERTARMLAGGIAYLRPGIFMNLEPGADPYDTGPFRAFVDKGFEGFRAAGARALLIDLRDNPGGHNAFSDHMVAWFATRPFRFYSRFALRASARAVAANAARLTGGEPGREISQTLADAYAKARHPGDVVELDAPPVPPRAGERFTGRVFVLINRRAYSNSVATAALIQDYGFGQVIGEETSDLATTFGAMEQFALPATGIVVGYPKAFIVRPSGDLAARGVVPTIAIPTPILETADDPVLRAALAAIA
jgi:hypothetical protein